MAERPLEDGWRADTPVDDSLLRSFLFNQADFNGVLAEAGGGRHERSGDLALADSTTPIPYFNQAVLLRPVLDAGDERLDRVAAFFAGIGREATVLSLWPTPDLTGRGWHLEGHPMLVARGPWGEPTGTTAAVVRQLDATTVGDYDRVMEEGYPLPGARLPPGALERGVNVYVADLDGRPVAGGAGYVAHGVVNLAGAATLPESRRTGAWGALVRARMADGPGLPAVAYTSDFSRPGFVHLGFLPITRCTLWVIPPG